MKPSFDCLPDFLLSDCTSARHYPEGPEFSFIHLRLQKLLRLEPIHERHIQVHEHELVVAATTLLLLLLYFINCHLAVRRILGLMAEVLQ